MQFIYEINNLIYLLTIHIEYIQSKIYICPCLYIQLALSERVFRGYAGDELKVATVDQHAQKCHYFSHVCFCQIQETSLCVALVEA